MIEYTKCSWCDTCAQRWFQCLPVMSLRVIYWAVTKKKNKGMLCVFLFQTCGFNFLNDWSTFHTRAHVCRNLDISLHHLHWGACCRHMWVWACVAWRKQFSERREVGGKHLIWVSVWFVYHFRFFLQPALLLEVFHVSCFSFNCTFKLNKLSVEFSD